MRRKPTYRRFAPGIALAVFALITLLGGEAAAQGCAMCKTAIGGAEDPLARGINASIFFMMGVPFALFAAVGGWLVYMFWGHEVAIDAQLAGSGSTMTDENSAGKGR